MGLLRAAGDFPLRAAVVRLRGMGRRGKREDSPPCPRPCRLSKADVEFVLRHLGVSNAQVSRWENDEDPIGPVADRLLRVISALSHGLDELRMIESLAAIDNKQSPLRVSVKHARSGWKAGAVA